MPCEATRAKELAGLIERVEAAAGPDREIDKAIFAYLGYTWRAMDYWNADSTKMWSGPVFLTYSIDAALALVERLLPGSRWFAAGGKEQDPNETFSFDLRDAKTQKLSTASAPTFALAILLALLRALSQEFHDAE